MKKSKRKKQKRHEATTRKNSTNTTATGVPARLGMTVKDLRKLLSSVQSSRPVGVLLNSFTPTNTLGLALITSGCTFIEENPASGPDVVYVLMGNKDESDAAKPLARQCDERLDNPPHVRPNRLVTQAFGRKTKIAVKKNS